MAEDMRAALIRLLPRLRRFGIALTGSHADADELVQDTCERAMRRQDQLRDGSRLDAWLYGIMRNRWTDEVRWRRIRRHDDIEAAHAAGAMAVLIPDLALVPDHIRRKSFAVLPDLHRVRALLAQT